LTFNGAAAYDIELVFSADFKYVESGSSKWLDAQGNVIKTDMLGPNANQYVLNENKLHVAENAFMNNEVKLEEGLKAK
jgi:hypothetical protein